MSTHIIKGLDWLIDQMRVITLFGVGIHFVGMAQIGELNKYARRNGFLDSLTNITDAWYHPAEATFSALAANLGPVIRGMSECAIVLVIGLAITELLKKIRSVVASPYV